MILRRVSFIAFGLLVCAMPDAGTSVAEAQESQTALKALLTKRCSGCHADGEKQGGFELSSLSDNLNDAAAFAKWERVYDRVTSGEMPPADAEYLTETESARFKSVLHRALNVAHTATRGTVLRRLNRIEYQNTMNDLFGVNLDLQTDLPEDGRYHEFDNVGSSLGLSSVHLKRYMAAANRFLDESIVGSIGPPESTSITADYRKHKKIGRTFRLLDDGAVARFSGGYLLDGQLQNARARERGWYRITINAYAYQSKVPRTFAVLAKTYASGGHTEILGYFSVPPENVKPVVFDAFLEANYFLVIDPHGIFDPDQYKRKTIDDYKGPGLAVKEAQLEGPINVEFPSRGHRLVFGEIQRAEIPPSRPSDRQRRGYKPRFTVTSDNEVKDARRSLVRVASAAFRRQAHDDDVARYVALFQAERAEGSSFEDSLRTAVVAIFCSPKFLYLPEGAARLTDHDLAVRLSLFLIRTRVDEELMRVAASGQLKSDAAELRRQTERLLDDARFDRFIHDFCDAWLDLRDLEATFPDSRLFPEFDEYLRQSMPLETRGFVHELIRSNLPITNLVASDFAMLNQRLAEHYDLPSVDGPEIRKVSLPANSLRGGLLSQAGILRVTANGTNTSPVTRGAWVMERILGETPQPPPPGTPGVEPDTRGATTLRELLVKHRSMTSCNSCHQHIDPPGFAMECFNPTGQFRERFRLSANGERVSAIINGRPVRYQLGAPVDSSGQLADGRTFDGFDQFRKYLADDPKMLAKTLTVKLLTFATGRELGFSDRAEIERIVRTAATTDYRIRDLIHLCVQSDIFRNE
jgi:hypothetical protein